MINHWFCRYLSSSVGKKQILGPSGLALCTFLAGHLGGNFLIFVGPDAFNAYGHALMSNPFIVPIEIALALLFFLHIFLGMKLTLENHEARPVSYLVKKKTGKGATFASSTMPYTGLIILAFLISHIIQFRFGPHYLTTVNGVEMRDLYKLIVEVFSQPLMVIWYVFCMIALGLHLSHGFASAFQSIGFNHPKHTPIIKKIGLMYSIFISIGFSSIPLWILWTSLAAAGGK